MHDHASELPRIPILSTSVNKGEGGQGPQSGPLVAAAGDASLLPPTP
jgi:hypothetical protein